MITLEKSPNTKKTPKKKPINVCWYESNTRVCGRVKAVDYFEIVESKMNFEPYYGDIDLFGF